MVVSCEKEREREREREREGREGGRERYSVCVSKDLDKTSKTDIHVFRPLNHGSCGNNDLKKYF